MVGGYALEGASLVGLSLSPSFTAAVAVLFCSGIGNVLAEVMRNSLVQLKTPDEVRGRVSALSQITSAGMPQIGQMQAGALAAVVGPIAAAAADGLAIAACAILI